MQRVHALPRPLVFALVVAAVIALTMAGLATWLASDHDLARIRREALRLGVDIVERQSPPWTDADRATMLAIDGFRTRLGHPRIEQMWRWPVPGAPHPPELDVLLEDERWSEAMRATAELHAFTMTAQRPLEYCDLSLALSERILVAPARDLPLLIATAAYCAGPRSWSDDLYNLTLAIAYRLDACRGQPIDLDPLSLRADRQLDARLTEDPIDLAWWYGQARREAWTWTDWRGRLAQRRERQITGELALGWIAFARSRPTPEATIARIRQEASCPIEEGLFPSVRFGIMRGLRGVWQARALIAILADTRLPTDWCDPTGAALRPVRRLGLVTAVYSVGLDGVDDGADPKRDDVLLMSPTAWSDGVATPSIDPTPAAH